MKTIQMIKHKNHVLKQTCQDSEKISRIFHHCSKEMNKVHQGYGDKTFEDKLEQQSKGFAKLAGSLRPFFSCAGNVAPNLAPNPSNVSPSTPFIQFSTIT